MIRYSGEQTKAKFLKTALTYLSSTILVPHIYVYIYIYMYICSEWPFPFVELHHYCACFSEHLRDRFIVKINNIMQLFCRKKNKLFHQF